MSRPRNCPHCLVSTPVQEGYNFDKSNNLLCPSCGKVMYPMTAEADIQIETVLKVRSTAPATYPPRYDAWTGQNQHTGRQIPVDDRGV